jgi:DNA-binding response OmpR family regulator
MRRTVLAVHPERHMRRLIEVNLKRAGYDVLTAADAVETFRLLQAQHIDLIMLDWMLTELQTALQNHPATRDIPVRMLQPVARPLPGN